MDYGKPLNEKVMKGRFRKGTRSQDFLVKAQVTL
jgi:hypothetical protein